MDGWMTVPTQPPKRDNRGFWCIHSSCHSDPSEMVVPKRKQAAFGHVVVCDETWWWEGPRIVRRDLSSFTGVQQSFGGVAFLLLMDYLPMQSYAIRRGREMIGPFSLKHPNACMYTLDGIHTGVSDELL